MAAVLSAAFTAAATDEPRLYELWEPEPAPNRGHDFDKIKARGFPYDADWEAWSYPIGNGYVGANVFGRVDTERVQITEKTLHNRGCYENGGATNFAEVYLDFDHDDVSDYRRSLSLNDAIARVSYSSAGVVFSREYFASYPDNVVVLRLDADREGAISLTVRPEIPYLGQKQRSGRITVDENLLTLKGKVPFFSANYEGQIKVIAEGGTVHGNDDQGTVTVKDADAVTILIATGTNYRLGERIFTQEPRQKLDPAIDPHDDVSQRIAAAEALGYDQLKKRHLDDYQNLFGRVSIDLGAEPSTEPTHVLLDRYKTGEGDAWLEEMMFQYGRYLLIASSREKSLPANLQGAWTQYYFTPWSGGYWHNINVQMNYWGAMSANLPECFESYIAYFEAYLPKARQHAQAYVRQHNPDRLDDLGGDNGWIVGTGANAYHIGGPGGHSGPGTGGFTAKLLVDYYLFTQDRDFLENVAYPAMLSLSKFYSKALVEQGKLLLVQPSASPEITVTEEQAEGMPGERQGRGYYVTRGCTFDQAFVWESFRDTLLLAEALGKSDPFLATIETQMSKLDPILIGASGQIKEFREENEYADLGDPHHRHISHLCALYPGTLIDADHPEWRGAAEKTLDLRGSKTTGWAMAHRMNCRARLGQGDEALEVYQRFIRERTQPNLWTLHPPFQIDGNFGTMAGVVELLLQSHNDFIDVLPALPADWPTGRFAGLVARGNFVVDASWADGNVTSITVTSRSAKPCRLRAAGLAHASVTDADGQAVEATSRGTDELAFDTEAGKSYTIRY